MRGGGPRATRSSTAQTKEEATPHRRASALTASDARADNLARLLCGGHQDEISRSPLANTQNVLGHDSDATSRVALCRKGCAQQGRHRPDVLVSQLSHDDVVRRKQRNHGRASSSVW
eukprot:scaffold10092_cov66-Phaeocystis_antarctica.AAC.4